MSKLSQRLISILLIMPGVFGFWYAKVATGGISDIMNGLVFVILSPISLFIFNWIVKSFEDNEDRWTEETTEITEEEEEADESIKMLEYREGNKNEHRK